MADTIVLADPNRLVFMIFTLLICLIRLEYAPRSSQY